MKLRFLGQIYSQFQQQIPTIASENTACYRGQQYNLSVPVAISPSRSPECLTSAVIHKYRGVSYVVEHHQFPTEQNKKLVYH